jgi:hypothetical protein
MRPDEPERRLRARLDALGLAPRAELLHVLMLPDLDRAERIGEFWSYPQSRTFAELLIDCEEDRTLRAVLIGMLRKANRGRWPCHSVSEFRRTGHAPWIGFWGAKGPHVVRSESPGT